MTGSDVTSLRGGIIAAGLALAVVGVGFCQILARPEASSWAGAVALTALCLLVGLGTLPQLGGTPTVPAIVTAAGVWGVASVIGGWLQVADRAGISPFDVGLSDISTSVEMGLPVLVGALGSLTVLAWCAFALRGDPPIGIVAMVAALGILVVSVTGHGGHSAWVPVVLGVHALSAAWWAGTLAALIVTVRGKGGWARILPEFSSRALPVVAALTVTGVIAAVVQLGIGSQLWDTGYGRTVVAKTLLLAVTLGLAWWHRRSWVPRARRHGVTERESIIRAGSELLILAVVLGLAAGLATTGVI
ncbi:copper resistance D family protein [Gordonia sp. (in: high G+C Gram-positive bacteria)]|uniref:copper resistance D family protein n=1 Tax=Gordonia sp. (in: high G+C Gram-positive bacteria) TaxID=84139 RepID=UPI003C71810F